MKKWLSTQELDILGRPLTTGEAREVQNIARRIAPLPLLQPRPNANYWVVIAETYA